MNEATDPWALLLGTPEWHARAVCLVEGHSTSVFYPPVGLSSKTRFDERTFRDPEVEAKEICARCPVRSECLLAGLDEPDGIWGGRTERERRIIRARMRGAS